MSFASFVLDKFKFEYGAEAFPETENSSDKNKSETAVKQDLNLHQKEASEKNTESGDSSIKSVPAKEDSPETDAGNEPKELNRQVRCPGCSESSAYFGSN